MLIQKQIPVIASVDFSHYRSLAQAEDFDIQTRAAIDGYNIEEILNYNNDHVDSPKILSLAVMLARDQFWSLDWRWHGNSQLLQPQVDDYNTTSYYIIGLTQPKLD